MRAIGTTLAIALVWTVPASASIQKEAPHTALTLPSVRSVVPVRANPLAKAAARAAECVGFPANVVRGVGVHYTYESAVVMQNLPDSYETYHVKLFDEGGCDAQNIGSLPTESPKGRFGIEHAIGIHNLGEARQGIAPLYVVIQISGSGDGHDFLTLKVPMLVYSDGESEEEI